MKYTKHRIEFEISSPISSIIHVEIMDIPSNMLEHEIRKYVWDKLKEKYENLSITKVLNIEPIEYYF